MIELTNWKMKLDSDGPLSKLRQNLLLTDLQLSIKNNLETKLSYKVKEMQTTTPTLHMCQ